MTRLHSARVPLYHGNDRRQQQRRGQQRARLVVDALRRARLVVNALRRACLVVDAQLRHHDSARDDALIGRHDSARGRCRC
jgi:hypothetical protein